MKKLYIVLLSLFCMTVQGLAQNCFNVYQEKVVLKQIPVSEVDSISVTEATPHVVTFWHAGSAIQSYNTAEIDSITVNVEEEPFSYLGVVGFNDELYVKGIDILATSTVDTYRTFISNLPRHDGTLLYYAVDNALDLLGKSDIKTPLTSVNLVTFTDGLDQGSIMMNSNYTSSSNYLNAISEIIGKNKYYGLPVNAYAVGLRGNDVSDMTTFRNNLARLASSPEKSFEVSSISDLRSKFQNIANQIISVTTRQTISLRIPGIDTGTRVRFVFDGMTAETSSLYIEGTVNLADRTLRNVTYHGMKSRSGSVVQGTQEGIFLTFTFLGLQRTDGGQAIPTSIRHYYLLPSSTTWQLNSEFTPDNNTQRLVSHSGTAIMLVLDGSSSLGNDFSNVKQYASEFIGMIANNAQPFSLGSPSDVKAELDYASFSIVVSWDAVNHAESYRVYRSSSANGSFTLVADNVTSTTWKDEKPLSGSNCYRVEAIGHGLTSSRSAPTEAVNYALDAPSNVKAELDYGIVVSWDAVNHAEFYRVYRSSSSNGSFTLVADNVTSTTWKDEKPLSGNNYYRVEAVGHGLTSSRSASTEAVNYALDAPSNVKAELDDASFSIVVSWDAVNHAESYRVYRSSSSNGSFTLVADNVTSTTWKDEAPLLGNNYYRVEAVGHGLTSSRSNATDAVFFDGRSGTINGRGYVDLGLPSGTLWAVTNIGADNPEDYGLYFAWGETTGYTQDTSDGHSFNWASYKYCKGSSTTLTKYCYKSSYGYNGFTDTLTELEPEDDAAYVNWGSNWRMPSLDQIKELYNSSYTTTTWTTLNGVSGRKITSKSNGNSLFLPAAGRREGSNRRETGSSGFYWSRTPDTTDSAYNLYFNSGSVYTTYAGRCGGMSVRPVRASQ